ncbi:hypothetical protein HY383_01510 [Candidatus Daviesbacteria bacterium]|nr:hypothetical protein [Candidatus Daviesbacteria bacterium]
MQKGFAQPLLIVLGLIVLVTVGVYFYQNSKVNVPLQTPKLAISKQPKFISYENTNFGFGFEYPNGLNAKEDSEEEFNKRGNGDFRKNFKGYVGYEPGKFLGAVAVLDKSDSFDASPFTIWIFDNTANLTVDAWFDKYWYYPYLWGVFDYTSKSHVTPDSEATVSGQLAKYKVVDYQPGRPKFVYLAKDQKMYLFRIIGETGDKILSTFKFLK